MRAEGHDTAPEPLNLLRQSRYAEDHATRDHPMRLVIFGFAILLIFLPVLLILFARDRTMKVRAVWAIIAFISPIATIAAVNLIPALTNNSASAQQWERFLGVVISGSGFILPWVIFALFLHAQAKPGARK
jgi:ABC-type iron transport system FetAB permease component